jgi:hypothetical protein
MIVFLSNIMQLTQTNMGYSYDFTSSMGHLRPDSVGLLEYDNMRKIPRVLMLYYRSFRIVPTLSGKGLIS